MNTQMDRTEPQRTPLYGEHEKLGARFTEFSGWMMPLSYAGLSEEHLAVRNAAGLFDVSHMGEIIVSGPNALRFLQRLTTNDVAVLQDGRAQYSLLLNEQGGVIDDIIVYRLAADSYLLCVNAGNTEKDWQWIKQQCRDEAKLENASFRFAQIAIQGPKAVDIVAAACNLPIADLTEAAFPSFSFKRIQLPGLSSEVIIARTGYTGEDGFELFIARDDAVACWKALLIAGKPLGLQPVGLGARDTLRLEACLPLHGHEISDSINPLEAGLGWAVKLQKGDFIGKEALLKLKAAGLSRKLVGLKVLDRGIVREGAPIFSLSGQAIGSVSSGTQPPFLQKAIALGLITVDQSTIGNKLLAEVRGKRLQLEVIPKPFYKRQK